LVDRLDVEQLLRHFFKVKVDLALELNAFFKVEALPNVAAIFKVQSDGSNAYSVP